MAAGRPTMYKGEETIEAVVQYMNGGYLELGHKIPSVAGLAGVLDVTRETIHVWCGHADKEAFSNIIEKLLSKQEEALISNGLDGTYNPTITKLILGKHGYSDKQDTNHSGNLTIKGILEEIQDNG